MKLLVIPNKNNIEKYLELADKCGVGFEYNDFFAPSLLDDEAALEETVAFYKKYPLPAHTTMHGAFLDVIPFSQDERIKKVSAFRIHQSMLLAQKLGVKAVVFHANYNARLNSAQYVESWIEKNASFWSEVLDTYPEISIYLENMFEETPDVLEGLAERLEGYENFGLCLDYSHAALSKTAPTVWAQRLSKYIKHVHINDHDGISDLHMAWGKGVTDRKLFYETYSKYLEGATVLIETSALDSAIQSLQLLKEEGFA